MVRKALTELSPSFRGAAQRRTRSLEIPGSMLAHRPGMTGSSLFRCICMPNIAPLLLDPGA
jgi:hypothetical protein